jgi:hypothetical protein
MTCTVCNFEFCWACCADFTKIRLNGNDEHKETCPYHTANLPDLEGEGFEDEPDDNGRRDDEDESSEGDGDSDNEDESSQVVGDSDNEGESSEGDGDSDNEDESSEGDGDSDDEEANDGDEEEDT